MGHSRLSRREKFDKAYHEWLVSLVDGPDGWLSRDYSVLMDEMDHYKFTYEHPWDENRITAVYSMRRNYVENVWKRSDMLDVEREYVTILEVLVCIFTNLSENVFTEPGDESLAPEMFYVFLSDLNLLWCDNDHFDCNFMEKTLYFFCKKDKKVVINGVSMDKKLDFWAQFSTIFCKKW